MGMRYEAEVCRNEINMNGTLLTADVFRATLAGSVMAVMQANFTDCVAKECTTQQLFSLYHRVKISMQKWSHFGTPSIPGEKLFPHWCNALRYSFVQCYYCC